MKKPLKLLAVPVLLLLLGVTVTACGGSQGGGDTPGYPTPAAGSAFFTRDYDMPQTQSAEQMSEWLVSEHFEYDLDGWFFFGSLVDSAAPTEPGTFIISMQRIEEVQGSSRLAMVPAIVAYGSPTLGQYMYGGEYALDVSPQVNVESDPWKVELNSPTQAEPIMTMELVSGSMGAAGAEYRLSADIADQLGGRLQAEALMRDRLGVVNQGYGKASFFPQFLTNEQRDEITRSHGNSVGAYLEATGDPMAAQGSYYYSQPLMDVERFTITRDGATLSSGVAGTMWMDQVVQTYDE
ncbi:MAG: hypothetical protein AB1384_06750 [Actinomycetota bacterium]